MQIKRTEYADADSLFHDDLNLAGWFIGQSRYRNFAFVAAGLNWPDALQQARIDLWRAACTFDEGKGKFITWAVRHMRQGAQRSMTTQRRWTKALQAAHDIADYRSQSYRHDWASFDRRELIDEAMKSLTRRDREIVKFRFGIGGCGNHTLMEVGREFKLGPERVRQIEARSLKRIEKSLSPHFREESERESAATSTVSRFSTDPRGSNNGHDGETDRRPVQRRGDQHEYSEELAFRLSGLLQASAVLCFTWPSHWR